MKEEEKLNQRTSLVEKIAFSLQVLYNQFRNKIMGEQIGVVGLELIPEMHGPLSRAVGLHRLVERVRGDDGGISEETTWLNLNGDQSEMVSRYIARENAREGTLGQTINPSAAETLAPLDRLAS